MSPPCLASFQQARGFHEEVSDFDRTGRRRPGAAGTVDGAVASRGCRASPGASSSGPSLLPPPCRASPPVSSSAAAPLPSLGRGYSSLSGKQWLHRQRSEEHTSEL